MGRDCHRDRRGGRGRADRILNTRYFGAALAALACGGCVVQTVAASRVRSALIDAGLSDRNADCMADRMVDRLTIAQLRKLEALRGEKRSLADYVVAVRRVGDVEVLGVTASSAALCTSGIVR